MIGRSVQSSWWPTLCRADSATRTHVLPRVTFLSWLSTICLILVGIAGVITPLGLSETIKADDVESPFFQYAADPSPFGAGTPPRYSKFTRFCGNLQIINCPGRFDGAESYWTASDGRLLSIDPACDYGVLHSARLTETDVLSFRFIHGQPDHCRCVLQLHHSGEHNGNILEWYWRHYSERCVRHSVSFMGSQACTRYRGGPTQVR